jgi:hypothetical protein
MENMTIVERTDSDGNTIEHVIIEFAPNEFRSMRKSTYDEQQAAAALSTPNLPE